MLHININDIITDFLTTFGSRAISILQVLDSHLTAIAYIQDLNQVKKVTPILVPIGLLVMQLLDIKMVPLTNIYYISSDCLSNRMVAKGYGVS